MSIKSRIDTINKKIGKLYLQKQAIIAECTHTNLTGEYKSNTGNWCPSDDSYWIDVTCDDCGKWWMIDSKEDDHAYRTTKFKKRVR
jgi:hypothetical protein